MRSQLEPGKRRHRSLLRDRPTRPAPAAPSFAPEVTRAGGQGHRAPVARPRLSHEQHLNYFASALKRRVPNPYEEKLLLGSRGFKALQEARQARYVHEIRSRPSSFVTRAAEGFTQGALGAIHLALPIEIVPQAAHSFRHPIRRLH